MAARESAEEKIARIVRETMKGERDRADEEKNPAYARLRAIIREEVAGVLTEQRGSRSRSRRDDQEDDQDDERQGAGWAELFGIK